MTHTTLAVLISLREILYHSSGRSLGIEPSLSDTKYQAEQARGRSSLGHYATWHAFAVSQIVAQRRAGLDFLLWCVSGFP